MTAAPIEVDGHRIVALTPETWPLFEGLAGRHNGVFGGCWCAWFHCLPDERKGAESGKEIKKRKVDEGIAHAALVMEGDEAIAWAEYGTVEELPNIHHRKEWEATTVVEPDFRITCVFVDKRFRRQGMASVAVKGALKLIARQGGGLVESYPHDVPDGKKMSSSFVYNGTRRMYERLGFTYDRPKGQGNCVMTKKVRAAPGCARQR